MRNFFTKKHLIINEKKYSEKIKDSPLLIQTMIR